MDNRKMKKIFIITIISFVVGFNVMVMVSFISFNRNIKPHLNIKEYSDNDTETDDWKYLGIVWKQIAESDIFQDFSFVEIYNDEDTYNYMVKGEEKSLDIQWIGYNDEVTGCYFDIMAARDTGEVVSFSVQSPSPIVAQQIIFGVMREFKLCDDIKYEAFEKEVFKKSSGAFGISNDAMLMYTAQPDNNSYYIAVKSKFD